MKYKNQCPICGSAYTDKHPYVFIHMGHLCVGQIFNHNDCSWDEGMFCFSPWMIGTVNCNSIQELTELSETESGYKGKSGKRKDESIA